MLSFSIKIASLANYWPIENSQMIDTISGANMTQGQGPSTTFVADRFGNENEALNLNGSWTQMPSGFYFNTPQFSIATWIYPKQLGSWSRLIYFGNGAYKDNVVFTIASPTNKPTIQVYSLNTCKMKLYSLILSEKYLIFIMLFAKMKNSFSFLEYLFLYCK